MANEETNPQSKDLPYTLDYAKSNRSACKECKETIAKDSLRMSTRPPSNWFHFDCVLKQHAIMRNPLSEASIRGLEAMKVDDQELVRQRLVELTHICNPSSPSYSTPKLDHAKSSTAKCPQCKTKLQKGEIRICYKSWSFHPACIDKKVISYAESILGFDLMNDEEKETLRKLFPWPGSSQSSSKSSQRSSSVHEIRQSSQSQSLTSLKAEDETKEENAKTKEVATKLEKLAVVEPEQELPPPAEPPTFCAIEDNLMLCDDALSRESKTMRCTCVPTRKDLLDGKGCGDDMQCINRLLFMECGARCPSGKYCTNKRFQKHQYADLEIFFAGRKGWGLRAKAPILKDQFIIEYVGEVVDAVEMAIRMRRYGKDKNHKHHYFMALRNGAVIDATMRGNISRFINHSCDPNAVTQKWTVNSQLRVGFFAKKTINVGEEIVFNYQFERYGRRAQECCCGSANCTGYIGMNNDDADDGFDSLSESDESSESEVDQVEEMPTIVENDGAQKFLKSLERKDLMKKKALDDPQSAAAATKSTIVRKASRKNSHERHRHHSYRRHHHDNEIERKKKLELAEVTEILNRGPLRNKDHVLEFNRLMVRVDHAESRQKMVEFLLSIDDPDILRLFVQNQGLGLISIWFVMPDADERGTLRMRSDILRLLLRLPINSRNQVDEASILPTLKHLQQTDLAVETVVEDVMNNMVHKVVTGDFSDGNTLNNLIITEHEKLKLNIQLLIDKWSKLSYYKKIPKKGQNRDNDSLADMMVESDEEHHGELKKENNSQQQQRQIAVRVRYDSPRGYSNNNAGNHKDFFNGNNFNGVTHLGVTNLSQKVSTSSCMTSSYSSVPAYRQNQPPIVVGFSVPPPPINMPPPIYPPYVAPPPPHLLYPPPPHVMMNMAAAAAAAAQAHARAAQQQVSSASNQAMPPPPPPPPPPPVENKSEPNKNDSGKKDEKAAEKSKTSSATIKSTAKSRDHSGHGFKHNNDEKSSKKKGRCSSTGSDHGGKHRRRSRSRSHSYSRSRSRSKSRGRTRSRSRSRSRRRMEYSHGRKIISSRRHGYHNHDRYKSSFKHNFPDRHHVKKGGFFYGKSFRGNKAGYRCYRDGKMMSISPERGENSEDDVKEVVDESVLKKRAAIKSAIQRLVNSVKSDDVSADTAKSVLAEKEDEELLPDVKQKSSTKKEKKNSVERDCHGRISSRAELHSDVKKENISSTMEKRFSEDSAMENSLSKEGSGPFQSTFCRIRTSSACSSSSSIGKDENQILMKLKKRASEREKSSYKQLSKDNNNVDESSSPTISDLEMSSSSTDYSSSSSSSTLSDTSGQNSDSDASMSSIERMKKSVRHSIKKLNDSGGVKSLKANTKGSDHRKRSKKKYGKISSISQLIINMNSGGGNGSVRSASALSCQSGANNERAKVSPTSTLEESKPLPNSYVVSSASRSATSLVESTTTKSCADNTAVKSSSACSISRKFLTSKFSARKTILNGKQLRLPSPPRPPSPSSILLKNINNKDNDDDGNSLVEVDNVSSSVEHRNEGDTITVENDLTSSVPVPPPFLKNLMTSEEAVSGYIDSLNRYIEKLRNYSLKAFRNGGVQNTTITKETDRTCSSSEKRYSTSVVNSTMNSSMNDVYSYYENSLEQASTSVKGGAVRSNCNSSTTFTSRLQQGAKLDVVGSSAPSAKRRCVTAIATVASAMSVGNETTTPPEDPLILNNTAGGEATEASKISSESKETHQPSSTVTSTINTSSATTTTTSSNDSSSVAIVREHVTGKDPRVKAVPATTVKRSSLSTTASNDTINSGCSLLVEKTVNQQNDIADVEQLTTTVATSATVKKVPSKSGKWFAAVDAEGSTYFYHEDTREAVWELPANEVINNPVEPSTTHLQQPLTAACSAALSVEERNQIRAEFKRHVAEFVRKRMEPYKKRFFPNSVDFAQFLRKITHKVIDNEDKCNANSELRFTEVVCNNTKRLVDEYIRHFKQIKPSATTISAQQQQHQQQQQQKHVALKRKHSSSISVKYTMPTDEPRPPASLLSSPQDDESQPSNNNIVVTADGENDGCSGDADAVVGEVQLEEQSISSCDNPI